MTNVKHPFYAFMGVYIKQFSIIFETEINYGEDRGLLHSVTTKRKHKSVFLGYLTLQIIIKMNCHL